jgi:NitT/TauT family transport system substrate-binding protein
MRRTAAFLWALAALVTAFAGSRPGCEVYAAQKVRMGYLQSDLHQLAAFVALEKGYFKAEGLDVEVAGVFKAGPELMTAFASKDLDFGYVGEAPATVAVANKIADVKIIAQANLEGSAIVVRKDSGIKKLEDLIGKTVAVPGYAVVQDFLLRKALTDHRIALSSVKTIVIKPPEMIPALDTKQIDAFVAWEPYPAKAITSGVGEVLTPSGKIWPGHPCCALVADGQLLAKNPAGVKAILRAHVKATDFIRENPEEAIALGVKFTGMDAGTVRLAMKNLTYQYVPDVQGLLEYVTFLAEIGQIKKIDPRDFVANVIRKDLLEEIAPKK